MQAIHARRLDVWFPFSPLFSHHERPADPNPFRLIPPPHHPPHTTITRVQPSSDLYAKFDQLMLLVSGRVVYYGEAAVALRYFQALGKF
jgi:hypothetical protein